MLLPIPSSDRVSCRYPAFLRPLAPRVFFSGIICAPIRSSANVRTFTPRSFPWPILSYYYYPYITFKHSRNIHDVQLYLLGYHGLYYHFVLVMIRSHIPTIIFIAPFTLDHCTC